MNDKLRSLKLEEELGKLDQELDDYCWNVRELSTDERNDIKELYKMWKTCLNKKLIIDNIQNSNIRISDKILNGGKVLWEDVKRHHSLHFLNCENVTIVISEKVNHITLERCKNVNIRSTGGSVSGIDIIKCNNVTHIFESGKIYFMDISNTTQCSFILSEEIAKDIMITTTSSFNLNFKTICSQSGVVKNRYKTNMNIFQSFAIYSFHTDDDDILSLYIVVPNSDSFHLVSPL